MKIKYILGVYSVHIVSFLHKFSGLFDPPPKLKVHPNQYVQKCYNFFYWEGKSPQKWKYVT